MAANQFAENSCSSIISSTNRGPPARDETSKSALAFAKRVYPDILDSRHANHSHSSTAQGSVDAWNERGQSISPDIWASRKNVPPERIEYAASLEGTAKVFERYICGAIRRIQAQTESMTSWKASVTMLFPLWGGPVDCLMSLDVCESDVEHLAMLLFNAQVKWAEDVLHIVLDEGITLIIPSSEATLKGVRDEAILKVFGSEIHNAINESPIRRRELKGNKQKTECVSMILTKNGAIINLSLGLDRSLEIEKKLYT